MSTATIDRPVIIRSGGKEIATASFIEGKTVGSYLAEHGVSVPNGHVAMVSGAVTNIGADLPDTAPAIDIAPAPRNG